MKLNDLSAGLDSSADEQGDKDPGQQKTHTEFPADATQSGYVTVFFFIHHTQPERKKNKKAQQLVWLLKQLQ